MTLFQAVLSGAFCAVALMTFLWARQLKTRDASWVDLGWTLSILIMSAFSLAAASGNFLRKGVFFVMVLLWAGRLSLHLTRRLLRHPGEDARYHKMRLEKKGSEDSFFLFIFLFQAAVAIVLSVPFWISAADPTEGLGACETAAVILWFLAFSGESLADRQLARFKADPANRGKVCQAGLWNYSRHPNYFFECLIWISYFLYAAPSPGGLWAAVSPALMIFFIVKVSGLPPAEEQSLRSKGELYRAYQRTTSPLVPWFKKKAA